MSDYNIITPPQFNIHHIGYAVSDMEKAQQVFKMLCYQEDSEIIDDIKRNIRIMLLRNNKTLVELISILNREKSSPIDFLFRKKLSFPGNGIPYHICYEVNDIHQANETLIHHKFKVILPIAVAPIFEGRNVSFLYHKDIGLIELLQR